MTNSYDINTAKAPPLPGAFIIRRLQSFTGFFIVIFLIEHLLVNSQSALFLGDDGIGFINSVNSIHGLPYLQVIEISLLAVPILIHGIWGLIYLRSAKYNSFATDGSEPSLAKYPRNVAFTWQRVTSVILVVGIILHVVYMRFLRQPEEVKLHHTDEYLIKVSMDPGLYTLGQRLNLKLYDSVTIRELEKKLEQEIKAQEQELPSASLRDEISRTYSPQLAHELEGKQDIEQLQNLISKLKEKEPLPGDVLALSSSVGTALLMMVRDTFKSLPLCILYTIFILAACFHGCNGLWTFAISWGISLSERSRMIVRHVSNGLMALLIFLGLASIWGTYWINLRQ